MKFLVQKKIRTPTAQTIFRFFEEIMAFSEKTKMLNGDVFAMTLRNGIFDATNAQKNEKLLFCVGSRKTNGASGPPRRNLRGECFAPCSQRGQTSNMPAHLKSVSLRKGSFQSESPCKVTQNVVIRWRGIGIKRRLCESNISNSICWYLLLVWELDSVDFPFCSVNDYTRI